MNRKEMREFLLNINDVESVLDRSGNVNRSHPLYSTLKDIIFYTLLTDEMKAIVDEFVAGKHRSMKDVAMNYQEMFEVMIKDCGMDVDPEEAMFSGLLDDEEYEQYTELKKSPAFKNWNAARFYSNSSRNKDKNMAILAKMLQAMLEDRTPAKEKPKPTSLRFSRRRH